MTWHNTGFTYMFDSGEHKFEIDCHTAHRLVKAGCKYEVEVRG